MPHPATIHRANRRVALKTAAAVVSSVSLGCRPDVEPVTTSSPVRTDVPLRVVVCGTEADGEAIVRAWAAVNPQPLQLAMIAVDRQGDGGWMEPLVQASQKSDLMIYPLLGVAELSSQELLMPLSDEDLQLAEEKGGPLLPALRNGVARFGDRNTAFPLGAHQPAIISHDVVDEIKTWSDYDRWVESLEGAAAEPLADGWAAAMFLWRAASTIEQGWLFGRVDLEPTIDTEPYQACLSQMKETAQRYKIKRSTPKEIWSELNGGSLQGGLGFAFEEGDNEDPLSFRDSPMEVLPRVLADPFSPVVSLSAECRQSAASKQFIRWLSGGEGSDVVRRQVSEMTATRTSAFAQSGTSAVGGYKEWLQQRLQTPTTLPTLQLLQADQYYAVLDRQVIRCLQGEATASQALAEVKASWQQIADRVGLNRQQRAWRQAQGMTA